MEPALEERVGRTKQLVVELLSRIHHVANGEAPAVNLDEFLAVRALKTENLAYRDVCISLREQLLSAKLDLVVAEIRERQLNRMIASGELSPSAAEMIEQNGSSTHSEQQAASSAHASSDDAPLPAQKRAKMEQEAESKAEASAATLVAQAQLDEAQRRIDDLTRQLEASQQQLKRLQAELSNAESLRSGAEQRANQLFQESESLRHQLQDVGQKLNEHFAEMASKLEHASQASQRELEQLKVGKRIPCCDARLIVAWDVLTARDAGEAGVQAERNALAEQVVAAQVLNETVQSLQAQIENYHMVYQAHDSQLTLAQQHREQAQQQARYVGNASVWMRSQPLNVCVADLTRFVSPRFGAAR